MIKKYLYDLILKRYQRKKIYMLGLSHVLSMRNNYSKIKLLKDVDYKIFSQNGEDGILDYLISSLKLDSPKFLEIGVGDFTECNTRFIFERCASKGTIIDCMNNLEENVKKNLDLWKGDLKIINEKINTDNFYDLVLSSKCLVDLDIFSIDIDGIDYWIINELPKNFSKIAVLEYNPLFGSELEVTVPNLIDFERTKYHYSNLCFGMSLKAAVKLMQKKNFYFVGTNIFKNNAFFISNKFDKNKFFKNLKIEKIKNSVKSNFRESRDIYGNLNYLDRIKGLNEILECKLVDLTSKKKKNSKLVDILKSKSL